MNEKTNAFSTVDAPEATKIAALDIGSNSFHLVIARVVSGSVQVLHRWKQKVRLAEGLNEDNFLSDEVAQRGLSALQIVAESLKGFEPDSVRIVATHTLRRATNAKSFINAARKILPYPVEIISGTEEARLIYSGVAHTNHDEGKRLVIDIGGGSTEFVIGNGFDATLCRSLQMGCVSYTKRFFSSGELKGKFFERAITAAEQELELIEDKYQQLGWAQCIGTSGTIKTLYALCQNADIPHEQPVSLKALKELKKQFIHAGHIDKLPFQAINEDRRPVIAAGLAILIGIFESLKIDTLEFSPAALREGVLYQMNDIFEHSDIRERTAISLASRYAVDTDHAERVCATTLKLFDDCKELWNLNHTDQKAMLGWAALLHEVGLQINSRGVQRHSAYILQNIDLPGFNQEQQDILATLVRFHRKKIRQADIPEFAQFNDTTIKQLIGLLRLGVLVNIKRQEAATPNITVKPAEKSLAIYIDQEWLQNRPIFYADLIREQQHWQTLGLTLSINDC